MNMSTAIKHTPLTLRLSPHSGGIYRDGEQVAYFHERQDAEHIFQAVNEREALLEAEDLMKAYRGFMGNTGYTCRDNPEVCKHLYDLSGMLIEKLTAIRKGKS